MTLKDVYNKAPVTQKKLQQRLSKPVKPLSQHKKPLTPREWKFVQELVSGAGAVSPTEAAKRAGYTDNTAPVKGYLLTNPERHPNVVAAIQEYRAELALKYGTTYERHMKDMQTIRDAALAAGAYGAAVQAEYRRGQALGTIYIDRKEIRHGTIDSMSKEEVMRKLEEIKKLYGGPPPTAILEVQATEVAASVEHDPDFDPDAVLKESKNANQARERAIQAAKGKSAKLPDNEA